jgi:hypothetical protein
MIIFVEFSQGCLLQPAMNCWRFACGLAVLYSDWPLTHTLAFAVSQLWLIHQLYGLPLPASPDIFVKIAVLNGERFTACAK